MEKWRKGQQLFNFLEWLREHKDYRAGQSFRMADPFHIPDEDYNNLLKEYELSLNSFTENQDKNDWDKVVGSNGTN